MEQVLLQLAKVFGMRKAMQILGISSESELGQVISGGGFGGSLGLTSPTEGQGIVSNLMSPSNALRLASNQLTGGGSLPSIGGLGGVLGVAALPLLMEPYREQLTGYKTQEEYEQARQDRIDIDRVQMRTDPKTKKNLQINWERQGFNDDEIKEKLKDYDKKTADLAGLGITEEGDIYTGADMGEVIAEQQAAEKRKEESDAMVAKEIAAAEAFKADTEKQQRLKEQAEAYAAAQAAAPPSQITQPTGGQGGIQDIGGGGGQPQTGGGGFERGDYGGRGYHWKKGGRVDKALGGRSRDI
jgi:hypothetical protein